MKWLERFWFGCGSCHGAESCPLVEEADAAAAKRLPWSRGWALVFASATVFLLPLATAVVGAWACGRYGDHLGLTTLSVRQGVGLLGGLAAGVGLAKLIVHWARPRRTPADGGVE